MKQAFLFTFFCCSMVGCHTSTEKSTAGTTQTSTQMPGRKFFDYDEIDHYFNNFTDEQLGELFDNKSMSALDSFKVGVMVDDIPGDITDSSFIDNLEKIGFRKTVVSKSKFAEIDKIFVEKPVKEILVTSCIYIYRDIMIFRKNNRVVGTAKICFDCMGHAITGTNANTEDFGQEGDYSRLAELLHE